MWQNQQPIRRKLGRPDREPGVESENLAEPTANRFRTDCGHV